MIRQSSVLTEAGVGLTQDELIRLRGDGLLPGFAPLRRVWTAQTGPYTSPFKGRGMDFDEVRAYQPGDDVRNIDWRVTARTGHPHTKLYREERERPVLLMVDLGASMRFGTRVAFKSVLAARAAALLAWSAVGHGDRIGGVIFAGNEHTEVRPVGRNHGVLRIVRALCALHAQDAQPEKHREQLGRALTRLAQITRPGSLVFLLSDFMDLDPGAETILIRLKQHNDLVLGLVYDRLEAEAPLPGRYRISDGQRHSTLDTRDQRLVHAYSEPFRQRRQHLETLCRQHGIHFLTLPTDIPVAESLRRGLQLRQVRGPLGTS